METQSQTLESLGLGALGGITALKQYRFYNNSVTLQFDEEEHSYTRYAESGIVLIPGVTTAVHILDKSGPLTQWAANMCAEHVRAHLDLTKTYTVEELEVLLNDARFNFRDYTEKAADTGHLAHSWIEQYIRADKRNDHEKLQLLMESMPEDERARNGCIAALDWMQKHNVKWLYTERKVYSLLYDFAGTMDGLCLCSSCGDPECSCCGVIDAFGLSIALQFTDELTVLDWKTSNRLYDEYNYQTAAYLWAHAEEFPDQRAKQRIICRLGKDDAKFEARRLGDETFALDFQTYLNCLNLYNSIELGKRIKAERKAEVKQAVKEAKERAKAEEKEAKAEAKAQAKAEKEAEKKRAKEAKAAERAEAKERQRARNFDRMVEDLLPSLSTGTAATVSGVGSLPIGPD